MDKICGGKRGRRAGPRTRTRTPRTPLSCARPTALVLDDHSHVVVADLGGVHAVVVAHLDDGLGVTVAGLGGSCRVANAKLSDAGQVTGAQLVTVGRIANTGLTDDSLVAPTVLSRDRSVTPAVLIEFHVVESPSLTTADHVAGAELVDVGGVEPRMSGGGDGDGGRSDQGCDCSELESGLEEHGFILLWCGAP